jgi:hypothetical protein
MMSKAIDKRLDKAEDEAKEKLRQEVSEIFERYGNDPEQLMKASKYELGKIWLWGEPLLKEEYETCVKVFMPTIFRAFFEEYIYPTILKVSIEDEDKDAILGLDHLYIMTAYPDTWRRFMAECKAIPDLNVDPEGFANSRISQALVEEFKAIQEKLELVKNKIRASLAVEEDEDA